MKKLCVLSLCLGWVFAVSTSHAIDLKQSKVTQVVNDVQIISAGEQKQKSAVVNDLFYMPDILRTGTASRAELVAPDETVTRVGANTIFSFDPANRTIDLKQGSLLFHSPHGKGGGTIHTGSATASVLGSTLIVTTTHNGGFKVIALEDEAVIKLPNGLKQKLEPGQMTFILTNGTQLAPVIVFRLDELTRNSLLVKGFTQPLASLPLIQNQIDKQLKLILSGKATDTGLDAGDNASPNQVEVLDVNTISHDQQTPPPVNPPAPPAPTPPPPVVPDLGAAEGADATINQSSLTDASIPTPPNHVFTGTPFVLTGNNFFGSQPFVGFVARNIFINTIPTTDIVQTGDSSALLVDLSPYTSLAAFDLVAVNDFSIEGSVTFTGLSAQANLSLIAGNQFILSPGIVIEADVNNFLLASPATLTLDDVSLINNDNNISLRSGGDVSFLDNASVSAAGGLSVIANNNISAVGSQFNASSVFFKPLIGSILLDSTTMNASGHVIFIAPQAISLDNSTVITSPFVTLDGAANDATIAINNSTINASSTLTADAGSDIDVTGSTLNSSDPSDPTAGTVALKSTYGNVNITGASITTHLLTVNSGDGILLDSSGLTATGSGATVNLNARQTITVNNTSFNSFDVVNMAANTIVLNNVGFRFGSSVTLSSLLGLLNVQSAPNQALAGYVNFYNVTYGGQPAQNYIGSGITISRLP